MFEIIEDFKLMGSKEAPFTTMKKLAFILALVIPFLSAPALAGQEGKSYVAKVRGDGKFCAKVEIRTPGSFTRETTKCRTLKGWKNAGYDVSYWEQIPEMESQLKKL